VHGFIVLTVIMRHAKVIGQTSGGERHVVGHCQLNYRRRIMYCNYSEDCMCRGDFVACSRLYECRFGGECRWQCASKSEVEQRADNPGSPKLLDDMEQFALACDLAGNGRDGRLVRSWVKQLRAGA
jgi:hypothetical protein